MPIVLGPLFSLVAKNALGCELVYYRDRGRNIVRKYAAPYRQVRQLTALSTVLTVDNWNCVTCSEDGRVMAICKNSGMIYVSQDYGKSWMGKLSAGSWADIDCSSDGSHLIAGPGPGGYLYRSSDSGENWTAGTLNKAWVGVACSSSGQYVLASATSAQLYTSTDYGATMTARETVRSWQGVAMSGDAGYYFALTPSNGPCMSRDKGLTWQWMSNNTAYMKIATSSDGKYILTCPYSNSSSLPLTVSTNYGSQWTTVTSGIGWMGVDMSTDGSFMIATQYILNTTCMAFYSTNYGSTWTAIMAAPLKNWRDVACSGNGLYFAIAPWGSYVSLCLPTGAPMPPEMKARAAYFKQMAANWVAATPEYRASWNAKARRYTTGYNEYMRVMMEGFEG